MGPHRTPRALGLLSLLLLAGCAGYRVPPLTERHPAHPDAPTAAVRPSSRTLADAPSDIPSPGRLPAVASTPHGGPGRAAPEAAGTSPTVIGEGAVVATVPAASQLVVDHEAIAGFMDAMTMGYRVDPPDLLEGLQPGDRVRFTIDVPRRTITAIERVRRGAP